MELNLASCPLLNLLHIFHIPEWHKSSLCHLALILLPQETVPLQFDIMDQVCRLHKNVMGNFYIWNFFLQTFSERKAFPVSGWSRPLTLIRPMAPRAFEHVMNWNDSRLKWAAGEKQKSYTKNRFILGVPLRFVMCFWSKFFCPLIWLLEDKHHFNKQTSRQ